MTLKRKTTMKRKGTRSRNQVGNKSIKSLPDELLVEVLALVARRSVTDLFNAKLSCQDFLRVSNDNIIFEHASMDKFRIPPWKPFSNEASSFLERCKESGNAEALYEQGMYEYFSLSRTESGTQLLKRATEKGHLESTYVYSIILICFGNQFRKQGLELLSSSKIFRTIQFRKKIQRKIRRMWTHNIIIREEDSKNIVSTCNCLETWNSGWEGDDDIVACCDSCLCDRQVTFFCDLVRNNYVFRQS